MFNCKHSLISLLRYNIANIEQAKLNTLFNKCNLLVHISMILDFTISIALYIYHQNTASTQLECVKPIIFSVIEILLWYISTPVHELGHYIMALIQNPKSHPKLYKVNYMDCENWKVFNCNQICKIAISGIVTQAIFLSLSLLNIIIFWYKKDFAPIILTVALVTPYINLIPMKQKKKDNDNYKYSDGYWLLYLQRKKFN